MYASAVTRIIAGRARGRRLTTPRHARTRPTSDRVREAVFSAIATFFGRAGEPAESALEGLSFLDLYAGTGAVGLEAASRGAAPVVLVEKDRQVAATAKENCRVVGSGGHVLTESVATTLSRAPVQPFRIVWLDPPYELPSETVGDLVALASENGWLAPDPLVIVERSTRSAPLVWPATLPTRWERRYGETTVYYAALED